MVIRYRYNIKKSSINYYTLKINNRLTIQTNFNNYVIKIKLVTLYKNVCRIKLKKKAQSVKHTNFK